MHGYSKVVEETISFVANTIGVALAVEPGDAWRIDAQSNTAHIGVDYYRHLAQHPERLRALVMLDVWNSMRMPRAMPTRTLRRLNLERDRAELAALLKTIDRLEAIGDVRAAFAGYRQPLETLILQPLAGDVKHLSLADQWLALLLCASVGAVARISVDARVLEEWRKLQTYGERAVQTASKPYEPDPSGPKRFERLLALCLPGYQKLSDSGTSKGLGLSAGSDEGGLGLGAEGSASELQAILDAPIEGASEQMMTILQGFDSETSEDSEAQDFEQTAMGLAAKQRYQARMTALQGSISKTLDALREYTLEQQQNVMQLSRSADPEGEVLDEARLATALAEALGGVARPNAFRPRVRVSRLREDTPDIDFVLVIDRSSSMQPVVNAASDAAIVMTESLAAYMREVGDRVRIRTSLIVFGTEALLIKPLSKYIDDESRITFYSSTQSPQGATNDAAALELAGQQLRSRQAKRVVMVISDGDSADLQAAELALKKLRADGVEVWGIGVRDKKMLERYVPFGRTVSDAGQLHNAVREIIVRSMRENSKHAHGY